MLSDLQLLMQKLTDVQPYLEDGLQCGHRGPVLGADSRADILRCHMYCLQCSTYTHSDHAISTTSRQCNKNSNDQCSATKHHADERVSPICLVSELRRLHAQSAILQHRGT